MRKWHIVLGLTCIGFVKSGMYHLPSYSNLTLVNVADTGTTIPLASNILGAKLNSNLTLDNHTKSVSRSCFYHIRALRQVRGALDNSTAATVASALVSARLDYVNSILYGTSTKQITHLQRVQNALARVVVPNQPLGSSSLHLLKQLQWAGFLWNSVSNSKSLH